MPDSATLSRAWLALNAVQVLIDGSDTAGLLAALDEVRANIDALEAVLKSASEGP